MSPDKLEDMGLNYTPTSAILTSISTFSLSILVNLMFSSKIKKLNMVESLKGLE